MAESGRILLVDDDEDLRELLVFHFESNGYDVTACGDGAEAIAHLEQTETLPTAIVLDFLMPTMDGEEFLRRTQDRAEWADIPTIVLTGVDDEDTLARMFELGADDYVTKPFSPNELQTRIQHVG